MPAVVAVSRSRKLFSDARRVIPSGVNSPVRLFEPYPFFVARSRGGYLWDADGRRYVDLCGGYGALLLGHGRREVVDAVSAQLSRGTLYCAPTRQETELAGLIRKNFPSMRRVRLVNTGSEATMTAIRIARGYTGRKKIVTFEGCYHGAHDSVLVRAGSGSAHARGVPVSDGGLDEVFRNTLVARYNDAGGLERVLSGNRGQVACVIIEPVMANMGVIPPSRGFLRDVRRLTRQFDVPLVFDEVVTGFRVSPGGAQEFFGVRPDLTTLAKALGGGFAIAAVGGRRDMMDVLSPGGRVYQASTYAGNPVAVAAATAAVRTVNRVAGRMYPRLERYCARLAAAVGDAAADAGVPHQINRVASMMQVFFTDEPVVDYRTSKAADAGRFGRMFGSLLDSGVFAAPSQFEAVFLSDAHTSADIDAAIGAYGDALGGMVGGVRRRRR